jgi:hypothetical protein
MHYIKWIVICALLVSCKKETLPEVDTPHSLKNGLLVLNEGLYQQNNSSLFWVDLTDNTSTANVFLTMNNRPLGDTGNDLKRYGEKVYVVLNGSSTVEVMNAYTLESLKQIPLTYNQQPQLPRNIAFSGGSAYISSYDGFVNILDTTSLIITDRIAVGNNPEGLIVHGNYLYVANSGGLNFPNVDSTVYQINLNTNEVENSFHVGANPGQVESDNQGNIYVVKRGNYGNDPSELVYINTSSNTVTNLGIDATSLHKKGNLLYISYYDYNTQQSNVSLYDLSSQTLVNESLIAAGSVQTLYGIHAFDNGDFICFDAQGFTNSGYVKLFNSSGNILQNFSVGLNPNKLIYYE